MSHPETQGKAKLDNEVSIDVRDPSAKASRGWKSRKRLLRRESKY